MTDVETLQAMTEREAYGDAFLAILKRWFPPRGSYAYLNKPVDVAKLGEDHKKVLAALSRFDVHNPNFANAGLPHDARTRRRLLGLAPKTVLEDVIKGVPRWKTLREAFDKHGKLKPEKRPPVLEYLRTKYLIQLNDAQWLELATEVAAKSYGLSSYGDLLAEVVDHVSAEGVIAWAQRVRADRVLADELGTQVARALVKKTGGLPPEFDASITQYGLSREILQAIPEARRAGVLQNIFEHPRANLEPQRIAALLDLAPEATQSLIDYHVRQSDEDFLKDDWTDEVVALTALRKKHPRVDAILAAHEKRPRTPKPKPVKKKKPKSDYAFESSQSFSRKQLEAFKGERKKQLLVALEKFNAAKTIAAFYKKEAEDGDDVEPPQLWTITHKGEPKYEMWVFLVDNGTVFELGSSKLTGVEMMQGGFLAKKPKDKVLAAALQEIVPF